MASTDAIIKTESKKCDYFTVGLWIIAGMLFIYCIMSRMKSSTQLEQQEKAIDVESVDQLQAMFEGGKHCIFVYASWCGHCRACKEPYDVAAKNSKMDVTVAKVNGGEQDKTTQDMLEFLQQQKDPSTGEKLVIRGFPLFMCIQDGKVVKTKVGAFPRSADGKMPEIENFVNF